eukprot:1280333-Pleurochrysis_carterae.AAC.1
MLGEVVDLKDDKEKRVVALEGEDARFAPELRESIGLKEVCVGLLPEMSALASTFKCHLQLEYKVLTRRLVVLFETFHLLTVEVGDAEHCLREGLDDINAFQLEVEE